MNRFTVLVENRERKRRYTFHELMAGLTPENIHDEVDRGPLVGDEAI